MDEGSSAQPQWHMSRGGKQFGPFSAPDLSKMAEIGTLRADDLVWKPGYDGWKPASTVPGLIRPPALPTAKSAAPKRLLDALRRLGRGQQPLGEAFWLYGVVGIYAAIFAAALVFWVLGKALQYLGFGENEGALIAVFIALPLLLLYLVVAYVGIFIWRSASGRGFWGVLARLAVLFVLFKISVLTFVILRG